MDHRLPVYAGHPFLGGRFRAFELRTEVARLLDADRQASVVLDFAGVIGVSHSFADELLSALAEHPAGLERVFFTNCGAELLRDIECVADMHHLPLPSTDCAAKTPHASAC